MKRMIASAGLLALGVVGVETAHGQLVAGADKPWSVSGTLRGFYDDNYTTGSGSNRLDSFGIQVSPSLSFNVPLDQTTLSLSYVYSLEWYDNRPTNPIDQYHSLSLLLLHNFNESWSLDASDSFVYADEPDLIDPQNLSLPVRTKQSNYRNSAAINLHAQITPLFGLVLGYANTLYAYDQHGPGSYSAELDRFEHLVILDTRWQVSETTTGVLGYRFGAIDYTSNDPLNFPDPTTVPPTLPLAASSRNDYAHDFYVGADHVFQRNLSGSVRAGLEYVDYYNDAASGSDLGPYIDLSATYTYMDGGNLMLGFHVGHNATDQTGVVVTGNGLSLQNLTQNQESEVVYASIVQKITPKLTGTLTAQFQNSSYVKGVLDGETDRFYLLGLNLAYQFTHYISAEFGYNYDRLDSDVIGRAYDRNRVYLGVVASY